ncbi:hypothetical protein [Halalkalicoccus subterraneus]|uniref:hypothetical protein n=1 Tax=Halalkalicoccus subterraneus TaxID=2675002 RepID=UPI0013CE6A18|nr:hypothetical protein [Halalkalicoccus subterraneus]
MSDDLDNRKQRMWNMEEVRGGDTDINSPDAQDTADTEGTTDTQDTTGTVDTGTEGREGTSVSADGSATSDTADRTDIEDTEETTDIPDTEDTPDTTDIPADVPPDASIRELFLAAQEQGLTVDDLRNVNVYLFDRVHSEMNDLLAEVNYRAMKQRGDEIQMNKEFFNAIYRVASRHEDEVLAELELES